MKRSIGILVSIFSFILVYFASNTYDKNIERARNDENKEYPSIEKTKKNYNGHIVNISRSRVFAGKTFNIELNNGDKFAISGSKKNPNYKKKDLEDNLQIGDSIFYNYKTYEFYIFKEKEIYEFKLFDSY